jgi:hypothetical protein
MCDYEPLSFPPPRERTCRDKVRDFFLTGIVKTSRAKRLLTEMKKRSESPRALWGPDDDRYKCALSVGKIIQEEMGWPAPYFIPDDPLECVLYTLDELIGGDDLESALSVIESDFECSVSEYVLVHFDELTYGEFIDHLLQVKKKGTFTE